MQPRTLKRFGKHLRRIRKEKKMKQTQLAKLCGIKQPEISRYENNRIDNLEMITVERFAKALGVDYIEFFKP